MMLHSSNIIYSISSRQHRSPNSHYFTTPPLSQIPNAHLTLWRRGCHCHNIRAQPLATFVVQLPQVSIVLCHFTSAASPKNFTIQQTTGAVSLPDTTLLRNALLHKNNKQRSTTTQEQHCTTQRNATALCCLQSIIPHLCHVKKPMLMVSWYK